MLERHKDNFIIKFFDYRRPKINYLTLDKDTGLDFGRHGEQMADLNKKMIVSELINEHDLVTRISSSIF